MKDYKIYKNVISHDKIDKFLDSHNQFKKSRFSIFRAQGTTDFEKPILNKYNHQKNSIHNPHLLGFKFKFRKLLSDIIIGNEVYECLCDFLDKDNITHYQSMFFDVSTATLSSQTSIHPVVLPHVIVFKPDGTRMFIVNNTGTKIEQFSLSTPWQTSSLSHEGTYDVSGENQLRTIIPLQQ